MENDLLENERTYTPSSLINIFNDTLNVKVINDIFDIKGIYINQNMKEYSGYYYERIKDIHCANKVTLVLPTKIKQLLKENYIYIFRGYLKRKITAEGNIQLNFNVIKLMSQEGKSSNETLNEAKAIAIRNNKTLKTFKNFKLFVEDKLLKEQKPQFAMILGNNAIIKDDIFNALGEYIEDFNIVEYRINLSSEEELIGIINTIDDGTYDSIIITRGGGTGLEIFDKIKVLEAFSNTKSILVTAIGHAVDFTYLQSIADYSFDTPTALGEFLKESSEKIRHIISDRKIEILELNTVISSIKEDYENLKKSSINEKNNMLKYIESQKNESEKTLTSKLKEKSLEIFVITATVLVLVFIICNLIF